MVDRICASARGVYDESVSGVSTLGLGPLRVRLRPRGLLLFRCPDLRLASVPPKSGDVRGLPLYPPSPVPLSEHRCVWTLYHVAASDHIPAVCGHALCLLLPRSGGRAANANSSSRIRRVHAWHGHVPAGQSRRARLRALIWRHAHRSLAHRLAIGSLALVLLLTGIGLRAYTLGHISRSIDAANMEVISVYPMTPEAMQHVVALALADSRVEEALHREPQATFVVHILPHNYGMMGMFADVESHHMRPDNIHLARFKYLAGCLLPFLDAHQRIDLMGSEGSEYRLVFSRVDGPGGSPVPPGGILDLSAKMTPVYIADVNSTSGHLSETIDPPRRSFWGDVKMPIF